MSLLFAFVVTKEQRGLLLIIGLLLLFALVSWWEGRRNR